MKKMILMLIMVTSIMAANVFASDGMELFGQPLGIDAYMEYSGKYVWRGQNVVDDPVFWPGVDLTLGNFTFSFWGNIETTKINGQSGEFSEIDWIADYSDDLPGFEGIGFSVGTIYYYFPSVGDTTEIYWGLNFDLPLSPSFTVYHDVDDAAGTFVSFDIGHSIDNIFEISPDLPVGLDLGAELAWADDGYNHHYWGKDGSKLNYLQFTASFPVELKGGWSLAGNLTYVTLLGDSIRRSDAFAQESDYFFAGISISKSF